jgi:hypothetical protein
MTTKTSADEYFSEPYVDVDEWRELPARHRFVRGGFAGTAIRFSIYLPQAERYEGRFRAEVAVGAEVTYQATAQVPRGTGEIVSLCVP